MDDGGSRPPPPALCMYVILLCMYIVLGYLYTKIPASLTNNTKALLGERSCKMWDSNSKRLILVFDFPKLPFFQILLCTMPTAIQWQPVANMMSKRFMGAAEVFLQCSHIFKFCMENNIENANSFRDMARERYERNFFRGRHKFFSGVSLVFLPLFGHFLKSIILTWKGELCPSSLVLPTAPTSLDHMIPHNEPKRGKKCNF